MDHSFIYLIHIFFAGPLLMYGGHIGKSLSEKCNEKENSTVFTALMLVGLIVVLYHGYKYSKLNYINLLFCLII